MGTGWPEAKQRLDYKGNHAPCFTWNADSDGFRKALNNSTFYDASAVLCNAGISNIKGWVSLNLPQKFPGLLNQRFLGLFHVKQRGASSEKGVGDGFEYQGSDHKQEHLAYKRGATMDGKSRTHE